MLDLVCVVFFLSLHALKGYNNFCWLAGSFDGSTSFCPVATGRWSVRSSLRGQTGSYIPGYVNP